MSPRQREGLLYSATPRPLGPLAGCRSLVCVGVVIVVTVVMVTVTVVMAVTVVTVAAVFVGRKWRPGSVRPEHPVSYAAPWGTDRRPPAPSRRYIRSERSVILINFCLSIISSNALILIGQTQTRNKVSGLGPAVHVPVCPGPRVPGRGWVTGVTAVTAAGAWTLGSPGRLGGRGLEPPVDLPALPPATASHIAQARGGRHVARMGTGTWRLESPSGLAVWEEPAQAPVPGPRLGAGACLSLWLAVWPWGDSLTLGFRLTTS